VISDKNSEFSCPDLIIPVSETPQLRKEINELRKRDAGLSFLFDQLLEGDVEDE